MKRIVAACVLLLAGCQTTLDPNYALQLESYRLTITAQQNVEVAKANADEARYKAIALVAERGGAQAQQMAIMALALGGRGGADVRPINVTLPAIPENQEDRALKWAAIFAGPLTSVAQGYFGYRLGVTQSNNQASTTQASYSAFAGTAIAGYNANAAIANGAFQTMPLFKPLPVPAPNITINGNGVVGAGSYTGDNSGPLSGNNGVIRVQSPNTTTTTTTTNTRICGPADADC